MQVVEDVFRLNGPHKSEFNLSSLATSQAQEYSELLRALLQDTKIDKINQRYHSEYHFMPLCQADPDLRGQVRKIMAAELAPRQVFAISFLLLGEAWDDRDIRAVLGSSAGEFFSVGLELKFLKRNGDRTVALDELRLCTRTLNDGDTLYLFADTGKHNVTDRVYISSESYFLLAKLLSISNISGTVVDMGSGSGIHAIALALKNPKIERAIGVDNNPRAVNVAIFNSYLNRVSNRVSFGDCNQLAATLAGNKVQFACMNPPFVIAPEVVTAPGVNVPLGKILGPSAWGGPDGLSVFRVMRDLIVPHLDTNAELVTYSACPSVAGKPLLFEEMNGKGCDGARYQAWKVEGFSGAFTPREYAELMIHLLRDRKSVSPDVYQKVYDATLLHLAKLGITEIKEGFSLFRRGHPTSVHRAFAETKAFLKM